MIIPVRLLLGTILAILVSWIMIHLLAVFGIFLSLAYLVSWFFFPKHVPDLVRQIKTGLDSDLVSPRSLKNALVSSFIVLVISLLSIGLVYLEGRVFFHFNLISTPKTVRFVIPPKKQYRLGEIFPMKIELTDMKTAVNAVQVDIGYPIDRLEVVEISTQDSFAEIFIQKEINNQAGYSRLTGGLPNPGYQFERGVFGTIYFKSKQPGLAKVDFLPSSMVLANDGKGSNIIKELGSTSFLVLPEEISEEEREMQTAVLQEKVLGEQSDSMKLNLYEEGKILGDRLKNDQKFDCRKVCVVPLIKFIDKIIFGFWQEILRIFFR